MECVTCVCCNKESIFSFQDSLFTRRIRDFEVNLTRNKTNNHTTLKNEMGSQDTTVMKTTY